MSFSKYHVNTKIQQNYSGTSNVLRFFHPLCYKTVGYFTLYKIEHSDKQTRTERFLFSPIFLSVSGGRLNHYIISQQISRNTNSDPPDYNRFKGIFETSLVLADRRFTHLCEKQETGPPIASFRYVSATHRSCG